MVLGFVQGSRIKIEKIPLIAISMQNSYSLLIR
jgi:hypothetical protein